MKNRANYPENWEDEIRPRILKRDKYACQHCGLKHRGTYIYTKDNHRLKVTEEEGKEAKGEGEKVVKIFLQVAHLDHNPKNNEDDNLLSLCNGCHLMNDRPMNNLKRKVKYKNSK